MDMNSVIYYKEQIKRVIVKDFSAFEIISLYIVMYTRMSPNSYFFSLKYVLHQS